MGKAKKEKNRIARQQANNPGSTVAGNLRVKGENFYRDAKKVKYINMLRGGRPVRDSKGKVIKAAPYQSKIAPRARVQPDRRWFGEQRETKLMQFHLLITEYKSPICNVKVN